MSSRSMLLLLAAGLAIAFSACSSSKSRPPLASAPASAATAPVTSAGSPAPPAPPPFTAPATPQPFTVGLDPRGVRIDGRYRLLRGGSVQYFRIPPDAWRDRLQRFRAAGFNLVDLYVPWSVVEPREGTFEFDKPDLRRFLDLCRELGLYVYLRPGPHITNELDAGGIPAWLLERTTKGARGADGRVDLRTADPDFLDAVARYFSALNAIVRDYLPSRGGPVVLYGIENELNWFQVFHEVDKVFWHEGSPERPWLQRLAPGRYLGALRDLVRADGIDVPITTCPGDASVSAMRGVTDVVPMPNFYPWSANLPPERIGFDLLADMHSTAHGGAYQRFPSTVTETARSPQLIRRLLIGGLDGALAFNAVGGIQEGYRNAVVPNSRTPATIFDPQRPATLFVSPEYVFFPSVFDYDGPIAVSGALRESFFRFRRDNLLFDRVEASWGSALHTHRSGAFAGADPRVKVSAAGIGVVESSTQVHYWLEGRDGTVYLSLLNATGAAKTLPLGAVEIDGERIPRFEPLHVPAHDGVDDEYAKLLVAGLPLWHHARLAYTTSELLTERAWNGERLLVLYGEAGSPGELALEGPTLRVEHASPGVAVRERGSRLTVTYTHGDPRHLVLSVDGHRLRVVVVTRELAGRFWFLESPGGEDLALAGLDYLSDVRWPQGQLEASWERSGARPLLVLAPGRARWGGLAETSWDPLAKATTFAASATATPTLVARVDQGRATSDRAEASPTFDDRSWLSWSGEPRPVEHLKIASGHVWYRTTFDLGAGLRPNEEARLFVESASDFVGVYVNGNYVSTLCPMGTELDSHHRVDPRYRFRAIRQHLRPGRNVIAFRVELWGHGSFPWPRGEVIGTRMRLPALGTDSLKGLLGAATLAGRPLDSWTARAELGGEAAGYAAPSFDDSAWAQAQVPLTLAPGAVRWYRSEFQTGDLPPSDRFHAPLALELGGRSCKATVFLNGRLIGRWLSDTEWLRQGTWGQPKRNLWNALSPDLFPIPRVLLDPSGKNVLAIAFEDTSASPRVGRVDSVRLRLTPEDIPADRPIVREREALRLEW